ncbi:AAEL006764-PA, partial [Aedes aegypti]
TMDFYYLPGSAPCRAVQMTAAAVGVELNLKLTNLMAGEHMKPEFLKLNTLVDNGFSLREFRAIIAYPVEKYGKDDKLYLKDREPAAVLRQGYQRFVDYPQVFAKQSVLDNEKKMLDALEFLYKFLKDSKHVAGDKLTIADLSILATVSYEGVKVDLSKYPNVASWYDRLRKETPGAAINEAGCKEFYRIYQTSLSACTTEN